MKETLLSIVQDIMSDMDSDLVNSIDDTPEALQVAQIVKRTYYDLLNSRQWDHFRELSQLDSANNARPTHMKIPENTKEIQDVKYNKIKQNDTKLAYADVRWMYPDEFLNRVYGRSSDADNVEIIKDFTGVDLLITNNAAPEVWTSFDDEYVVFDSYDNTVDDFLQNSKSVILRYKEPEFQLVDSFVPDWPSEAFTLLIAEAKSRAFLTLSQEVNQKAEQQAFKAEKFLSSKNKKTESGIRYISYGRTSRK